MTGRLGARIPVRSVRAGGVRPDGSGPVSLGNVPFSWRDPLAAWASARVQTQDGAPRCVTPSLWSSGAWLAARRPFQQPRGLPLHSHPSLRLLEFMNSP